VSPLRHFVTARSAPPAPKIVKADSFQTHTLSVKRTQKLLILLSDSVLSTRVGMKEAIETSECVSMEVGNVDGNDPDVIALYNHVNEQPTKLRSATYGVLAIHGKVNDGARIVPDSDVPRVFARSNKDELKTLKARHCATFEPQSKSKSPKSKQHTKQQQRREDDDNDHDDNNKHNSNNTNNSNINSKNKYIIDNDNNDDNDDNDAAAPGKDYIVADVCARHRKSLAYGGLIRTLSARASPSHVLYYILRLLSRYRDCLQFINKAQRWQVPVMQEFRGLFGATNVCFSVHDDLFHIRSLTAHLFEINVDGPIENHCVNDESNCQRAIGVVGGLIDVVQRSVTDPESFDANIRSTYQYYEVGPRRTSTWLADLFQHLVTPVSLELLRVRVSEITRYAIANQLLKRDVANRWKRRMNKIIGSSEASREGDWTMNICAGLLDVLPDEHAEALNFVRMLTVEGRVATGVHEVSNFHLACCEYNAAEQLLDCLNKRGWQLDKNAKLVWISVQIDKRADPPRLVSKPLCAGVCASHFAPHLTALLAPFYANSSCYTCGNHNAKAKCSSCDDVRFCKNTACNECAAGDELAHQLSSRNDAFLYHDEWCAKRTKAKK
jgi:hypothetical protein